jgi:hypothetical protein
MKSFYTKKNDQEQSNKRPRTNDGAGAGGGAGGVARGASAAYCAELRAHDYEVQPEVIVNASGIAFESLFNVTTHYFLLIISRADAQTPVAISRPHCVSTIEPGRKTHREESSQRIK